MADVAKKYRVYLDRPNNRVIEVVEDLETSTTYSKYELLGGFTLQEAKANILKINPLFNVILIDIQIERDNYEEIEEIEE